MPYESGSGQHRPDLTSLGVGIGVMSSPGDPPIRPSVLELHQANQGGVHLPPGQQPMQAPHLSGLILVICPIMSPYVPCCMHLCALFCIFLGEGISLFYIHSYFLHNSTIRTSTLKDNL